MSFIYKRDIQTFLSELRRNARPIYALLLGMPESALRIVSDDDGTDPDGRSLSVAGFIAQRAAIRNRSRFRILLSTYRFRDEQGTQEGEERLEITAAEQLTASIMQALPHLLAWQCRQTFLTNEPLQLSPETIRRCKLRQEEIAWLQEQTYRCNTRIVEELRERYGNRPLPECLERFRRDHKQ